jgi:hypothetical protein
MGERRTLKIGSRGEYLGTDLKSVPRYSRSGGKGTDLKSVPRSPMRTSGITFFKIYKKRKKKEITA